MTQSKKGGDICAVPYCRRPSIVVVVGKGYCGPHNAVRLDDLEEEAIREMTG